MYRALWLDNPELSAGDVLNIGSAGAVDQIRQSAVGIDALNVGVRYPCGIA
jgi:hypothetical protein